MELLRKRRFELTLAAAALCVFAVAAVRPKTQNYLGVPPDLFWAEHVRWSHTGDVVLAGDSRVMEGLSPEILKTRLGSDRRILNYGYAGNGYTDDYLQSIEDLLRMDAKDPIIVLGITPYSLTKSSCQTNAFLEQRKPGPKKNPTMERFLERLDRFRPVRIKEIPSLWMSSSRFAKSHFYDYHADGWVGAWQIPETPEEGAAYYRERLYENPVLGDVEERVFRAVAKWRAKGIKVIGFRPPTNRDVVELENGLGKFDERAFVDGFERAGGVWLAMSQTGYGSYDGSHLRVEEAKRFTADFAAMIP